MQDNLLVEIEDMCKKCDKHDTCDLKTCDEEIATANQLTMLLKLQQIANGFFMNTSYEIEDSGKETMNRNIISFGKNPKIDLLIQTLNNIPSDKKVIIWSNFTHAIDLMKEAIAKTDLGESLTVYKNDNAFEQVEKFKQDKYRFLIANPSKAGVGLNIQFSSYQIYFSNDFSYVKRDQAEGRQDRQGQKEKVTVIDLICKGTVDEMIIKALQAKKTLSMSLTALARVVKKGVLG